MSGLKKRLMLIGGVIIIATFLSGCKELVMGLGPGAQDYSYEVGTGYKLIRSSAHMIQILPVGGNDLTNPKPEINSKVVEIAWNERYVLAKQIGLKLQHPNNPNNTYEIPDNSIVSYYILDTVELRLYGGYTLEEFNKEKTTLEISEELILKDVNRYQKA